MVAALHARVNPKPLNPRPCAHVTVLLLCVLALPTVREHKSSKEVAS